MSKFSWGRVIETVSQDIGGNILRFTVYHPWHREDCTVKTGSPDLTKIEYHSEELHESFDCADALLIAWIAHRRLGLNQHMLVSGICRALEIV